MKIPLEFLAAISQAKKVVAVSPHLDDALFSVGSLLATLAGQLPVTVVTLFTEAGPHSTLSARTFVRAAGFSSAQELFAERRREDAQIATSLNIQTIHCGFADALWRMKPGTAWRSRLPAECSAVYSTYRWHIARGKVSRFDNLTIEEIRNRITTIVGDEETVLFYPEGIGSHVDHLITKEVMKAIRGTHVLWADMPYLYRGNEDRAKEFIKIPIEFHAKQRIAEGYQTQYSRVFAGMAVIPCFSAEFVKLRT